MNEALERLLLARETGVSRCPRFSILKRHFSAGYQMQLTLNGKASSLAPVSCQERTQRYPHSHETAKPRHKYIRCLALLVEFDSTRSVDGNSQNFSTGVQ